MRKQWRGVAATAVAAGLLAGYQGSFTARAAVITHSKRAAVSTNALAFASAGQVAVLEGGALTTAGVGQSPLWSPDGSQLLFSTMDYIGNAESIFLADTHGANAKLLMSNAYPWINAAWSRDGKYVLYTVPTTKLAIAAPNAPVKATQITLKVEALKVGSKSATTLGTFSFTAGCSSKVTALQNAFALAEGSYIGTPSTLIWAQPNLVAVQSTCGGQGITLVHLHGGKNVTLPTWAGGVLSPDGSTIAATVAGSKPGSSAQVGLITVATGRTSVLAPKLNAGSVAWSPDSKNLYVAVMPTNPKSGLAQIYTMSKSGKSAKSVYSTHAAGIFHLSPLKVSPNVAFTMVASSAANAVVPPATLVENLTLGSKVPAQALLQGGQGTWRP
ncbi:MAG TPA: hypothetical protein VN837_08110 [Chloroflexota bacterium]|nr:hypothetical protein [Chloroflexota bacterium]